MLDRDIAGKLLAGYTTGTPNSAEIQELKAERRRMKEELSDLCMMVAELRRIRRRLMKSQELESRQT
ncbi:MAG: hypothetical protein ABFD97_10080 [Syntrophobacter sp.]